MKVKLDENIPRSIGPLVGDDHDVDTVADEGLAGRDDRDVAEAARREGRILMTLDRGFPSPVNLTAGHPGIVVLRLRDQSVQAVERAVLALLSTHDLKSLGGCVVIVAPGQIRIRRP